MNLPRFAVTHKSFVLGILLVALGWSIFAFFSLERREDPIVTQRQAEIVTLWPGASTENVEELITKKIADDLRGISHVAHVEGTSRPGISAIAVDFDDRISDAAPVLQDVRNHIGDIRSSLPAEIVAPALLDDFWSTYPMVLGFSVNGYSPRQLRDVARLLKDRIGQLPDVSLVRIVGEQEEAINADIDVRRLAEYGITPGDVANALRAQNALVPSGSVALAGRSAQVDVATSGLRSAADVSNVAIAAPGGRLVRVGDVARVHAGDPDPPAELVHVDGRPGIALAIQSKNTSSLTLLGPEVRHALVTARAEFPVGMHVAVLADQPAEVSNRVDDFLRNLCYAVVIVTVLVALFMGLRNGLLVGITVAISIALTFGTMPLFGIDINQISLLSLIVSLGIIVDAGIVAIDNIEHRMRNGLERTTAAWQGVQDLWFPLLTSTLVAISSFLPFRFVGGGSIGDFISSLGIVTSAALAISLLVAYFITPILGKWVVVTTETPANGAVAALRRFFDGVLGGMQRGYVPLATASLRRPLLTVAIAGTATIVAVAWIPHLGVQFFPAADRNQFVIDVNAPEGTDIRATDRIVSQVETLLAQSAGITSYGSFVGRGAPRFYYNLFPEQPKPSYAQVIVNTVDVATADRLVDTLQREARAQIVGARIDVKRFEQGPPVGSPIQIRLAGEDRSALMRLSARIQAALIAIPGTAEVRDSLGAPTTTVALRIDDNRASLAGVNDAAIAQVTSLAYGGLTATVLRESDRQTPVVLRLPAALRENTDAIASLPVRNASGANVPLGELVAVGLGTQTSELTVRDGLPTVTVVSEVEGRFASAVLDDFKKRAESLVIPAGTSLTYAGENAEIEKSFRNLGIALFVGLVANQTILLLEFRVVRLSLLVLAAVPLGIVGAVFGLAVTRSPFGFVAALGIASLGGIVTNHAIVLFEYANREFAQGLPMERALVSAGTKRLRPIMLTVLASIAGLLPLAFSGQTLWRPFCWALIFGLAGSMVMTLITIPTLYRLVFRTALPRTTDPILRPILPRKELLR